MTRRLRTRMVLAMTMAIGAAGMSSCVDTLPDEDLRITTATPVTKLSTAILWKDFQDDAAGARSRYWGKAVVITGPVSRASEAGTPAPHVFFAQDDQGGGIRAQLISERAAEVLAAARAGERLTLKCFCDGLAGRELVLRSCVRP